MKTNDMINQTLDQTGGDIISSKIILPFGEFNIFILINSPFWQFLSFTWRNIYEIPEEIWDCFSYLHHLWLVCGISSLMNHIPLIWCHI